MIVLFGGRRGWGIPEPIGRLFFLDQEYNVPTLYTSFLFVLCAFYCVRLGYNTYARKKPSTLIWMLLGILLVFLSADEWFEIHEKLIVPLRTAFNIEQGLFYFAWTIAYVGLVIMVGLVTIPWFRKLEPRFRKRLALGAGIYITGALVFEIIGSWVYSTGGHQYSPAYANIVTIEESLELIGLTLATLILGRYRIRRIKVMPSQHEVPAAKKRKIV